MNLKVFILPTCYVGNIYKNASRSIAQAVAQNFVPNLPSGWSLANNPMIERATWMYFSPDLPIRPLRLLIRDPVLRFLSAMNQVGITDVAAAISGINGGPTPAGYSRSIPFASDLHFQPQIFHAQTGLPTFLYRFPDHLSQLCADAGIPGPLSNVNPSTVPAPTATAAQVAAIQQLYAEDLNLFNSITGPGQKYPP